MTLTTFVMFVSTSIYIILIMMDAFFLFCALCLLILYVTTLKLLTCMDSLSAHNTHGGAPVAVIGATNRPNDLDPALRLLELHCKYM